MTDVRPLNVPPTIETKPVPARSCGALASGQRLLLLHLARRTLEEVVRQQPATVPNPDHLEAPLLETRACFVTLEKQTSLRGCIGHLIARKPLYAAVIDATREAASTDPRFAPVNPDELEDITLEISVLSNLAPLTFSTAEHLLAQLEPHRHGVVLHFEDKTATFLPQVWEQIPDPIDFLNRLALKGGWEPSTWRDARCRVSVYEVESFQEPGHP
jgi:AmmeMemoRadiSam system protein A